jgi:hypothetical protein
VIHIRLAFASFRLSRPRPGLTLVTRDHGVLGNLLAYAASPIERLPQTGLLE